MFSFWVILGTLAFVVTEGFEDGVIRVAIMFKGIALAAVWRRAHRAGKSRNRVRVIKVKT